MRALGYVRVSTEEQAQSEAGLLAQRAKISDEVQRRGWTTVDVIDDPGYSAKDLCRPGIQEALGRLKAHEADVLVVAKLDRLSRSILDFAMLVDRSQREGWTLVLLDCAVDTTTPAGELLAGVLALFAQFERKLIGQRTREGLAVKRAQGVVLGRPLSVDPAVRERIVRERELDGRSLRVIAEALNAEGVPTAQGGRMWYPSTVRAAALVGGCGC